LRLAWFWFALSVLVLVESCAMSSVRKRREYYEREIEARASEAAEFVDFGIVINVVKADPNGTEYLPGKPKLTILRSHYRGGIVHTRSNPPAVCAPSRDPKH
jgi:hypothetical protein